MNQLAVERIKLFSTRSPWWCILLAFVTTIGLATIFALQSEQISVRMTQLGYEFGLMVMMVMATLAITTEYRFGTIRATFQAVPNRTFALLAKATLLAGLGLIIGEMAAFGSWGVVGILSPDSDLALNSAEAVRQVAGVGLVFMVGSILALALGILIRHTAGAVALILLWSLLLEPLTAQIPTIGDDLQKWMPFTAARHFLTGGGEMAQVSNMPFGPWGGLVLFATTAAGLLVVALIAANRRDA